MKLSCPRGWKTTRQWHGITVHHNKVTILDGVCDSCDLCNITDCRFYDISPQATQRFKQALTRQHSLQGLRWKLQEQQFTKEALN